MTDNLTSEQRNKNMKAIKCSHTKMEDVICRALWNKGLRFRRNVKGLLGKPDIAIKKYKIVVFLDSCFWHKCPAHFKKPKSNITYWEPKIENNVMRDIKISQYYFDHHWHILRVWEHEYKKDFNGTVDKIYKFIQELK